MQIKFTVNVTEVADEDGELIEVTEEHYAAAAAQFIEDNKDVQQELTLPSGEVLYYEMEDIEVVK